MKRTTFDTDCLCGQHMTVTVDKGVHICAAWTATCQTVIEEAKKR
jgi:hypothetical protein